MKLLKRPGIISAILQIFIADSSSATGAGLTGLVFNTSGLTAYYHRDSDTTATAISLVTMTVGTFTASGFKEIDATNMPGWYQLCVPDAAYAFGAGAVGVHLKGAANMAPLAIEVQLDADAFGITDVGTLQAGSSGGGTLRSGAPAVDLTGQTILITSGTGAGQARLIDTYNTSTKAFTCAAWGTTVDTTSRYQTIATPPGSTANPPTALLSAGTGSGQVTLAAGILTANANGDLTATQKTSVTTAATAATPVAASVTGNVGGNVTGSVGSTVGSNGVKKNTAKPAFMFVMTDSVLHTPKTGLTVTAQRSLGGAAFANCANAVAEIGSGWYKIDLAAGDLNADTIALKFTATLADQLNIGLVTAP